MKFLESGFRPVGEKTATTFAEVVSEHVATASVIKIVTGYFGAESIVEFQEILQRNPLARSITFLVGMAAFDGLTQSQHQALSQFALYLRESDFGDVHVALTFPVHSKVMVMVDAHSRKTVGVMGSSNFSSLVSSTRQYETDLLVEQTDPVLTALVDFVDRCSKSAEPFLNSLDRVRVLAPKLTDLSNEAEVDRADPELAGVSKTTISFDIPIKATPFSHLNVFFGRGRVSANGRELPRPWYEAEIIVSKSITSLPGYPNKDNGSDKFTVVTDDGWTFECKVTGDYCKNFRSAGNLEILGKWLKGRLEEAGALKPGAPVTLETLQDYGRSSMRFTKLAAPENTWFLDFSREAI